MAAHAEGLGVLRSANVGKQTHAIEVEFADKLLSAMRYEFGGHLEKGAGR